MTVDALTPPRPRTLRTSPAFRRLGRAAALPYLLTLAAVAGSAVLAWRVHRQDDEQVAAEIAVAAAAVQADLTGEVEAHVLAFQRMASRWSLWRAPFGPGWPADAAVYLDHYPALSGIAWIGADRAVSWHAARPGTGGAGALDALLRGDAPDALEEARRRGQPVFGPPVGPAGVQRLLPLFIPLEGEAAGDALLAVLSSEELLRYILADQLVLGYGVDVSLYGVPVFRDGVAGGSRELPSRWLSTHRVELLGAPWVLRVWPGATLLATKRSWLPAGVFAGGLLLAGAFAGAARFARQAGRQSRELERAKGELERSNAELEQFAYVASHDLQEPLRQVASFLALLERRHGDRLDAEAREFIGFAVAGSHRMQQLINDLLTYSRVGTRGGAPEPTDPADALGRAVADLRQAIEDRGALVTNDAPLPAVLADPRQLALVFQNLLSNGIKYAGQAPPRIHVSGRRRGEEVEITVTDHGIGIEPRFFDRIFVIFQRLHTREEYPGTGIGLAIVRRAVEQHGGRVWIESAPGEGSTFHFTLPAAPEPSCRR